MKDYNYPSPICEYCPCTDYGDQPINTGYWNLCEGSNCEEAYENYKEDNSDDGRTIDNLF